MIKFLIAGISNALSFSKTEAKGTLQLIFILLILFCVQRFFIYQLKSSETDPLPDSLAMAWMSEVSESYEVKPKPVPNKHEYVPAAKGKRMKSPHEPYASKVRKKAKRPEILKMSNINLATPEELKKVRGIGPTFSNRIVKYRDMLGGFYSLDQLHEVYGLPDSTVLELRQHFHIASAPPHLDINTDSIKVLARHPYITYDMARVIVKYRQQHGNIHSIEELAKIKAVDSTALARLKPYLE